MEYILTLTFICDSGNKKSLTIEGVQSSVSSSEAGALMDTIISKDIFVTKYGSLKEKYGAKLTSRNISDLEIQ